jgi:hypothetical protein
MNVRLRITIQGASALCSISESRVLFSSTVTAQVFKVLVFNKAKVRYSVRLSILCMVLWASPALRCFVCVCATVCVCVCNGKYLELGNRHCDKVVA